MLYYFCFICYFFSWKWSYPSKEKYGQSFSPFFSFGSQECTYFSPESADSRLKSAVSWHHRAAPGSGTMLTVLLGFTQLPDWLTAGSISQHSAESWSQLRLPPLPPGTPVSAGGAEWRATSDSHCSLVWKTESRAINGHVMAQFSVLEPAGDSCSIEVSIYVCFLNPILLL